MKKIILFIAAAVGLLAFHSCRDNEEGIDPDAPVRAGVDYLVMLYGQGGGNLDTAIVSNIVQAIDEGGSDNVAMTFEYKLSRKILKNQELDNFDGTRRFTIDDNAHLKGRFKSLSKKYPKLDRSSFDYYLKNIRSQRIGNVYYDMSNADSLAAFIRWSKMKYPNAKRTILVLSDHGSGWILDDGEALVKAQEKTRAIIFDDNLDKKSLKVQDVTDAIIKGGGVDMCYTDACLMAMYENFYTLAKAVRYMLTAVEEIPEDGGDFRKLLSLLKTAGTTDAELVDAMHRYADHCVSDQWWGKKNADGYIEYTDIGLYDLSKLESATPVLKAITNTLAEKFVSGESIEPTATDLPLDDRFAPYIRKATTGCLSSYRLSWYTVNDVPETLVPYLRKDLKVFKFTDDEDEYFDTEKLIDWVKYKQTESADAAYNAYPEDWEKLCKDIIKKSYFTYSLTDLLHQIDLELSAVGAKNNPFAQLHDDLVSVVKSTAYIVCTEPVKLPDIDQPYEYCSPGIFIVPFNETYKSKDNAYNDRYPKYEDALKYYQATDFDKTVGWSSFLKVLDVVPSILFNPGRNNKRAEGK